LLITISPAASGPRDAGWRLSVNTASLARLDPPLSFLLGCALRRRIERSIDRQMAAPTVQIVNPNVLGDSEKPGGEARKIASIPGARTPSLLEGSRSQFRGLAELTVRPAPPFRIIALLVNANHSH
jgi:hypothetical protein